MHGSTKKSVIAKVDTLQLCSSLIYCIEANLHVFTLLTSRIGMSDLCSPMIVLLNDEADAFWCFERLMRRLVHTAAPSVFGMTCFLLISLTFTFYLKS